jgi:4-amino-4-deoxy-L-arabinose transferase-like glycosyltransferase
MSVRDSRPVHALILTAVWAVLTLPGLGSTSLWDIDEGLNAEAAREMYESGNYIVPTFNFQPRTAKPALLYWLQAAAYHRLGVTEFAARLPSALAALGVVLLTYNLARRMFDPLTGLLAGVILISSIQVCLLAHAATPDMLLLLGVMLGFNAFWAGYQYDRRLWLVTCAFGTAVAVLAKGPVGLALPAAVIGAYLLSSGDVRRLWDWRLAVGVVIFCAIALPWYVLVGSETRGAFLRGFWWNENVSRFVQPLEKHSGPPFFYLLVLVIGLAPWCVFLFSAVGNAWVESRDRTAPGRRPARFLLLWAGVYLVFFTIAATKLPNYILPTYPAFAVMTARALRRWQAGELPLPWWLVPAGIATLPVVGIVTAAGLVIAGGVLPLEVLKGNAIPGLETWAFIGVIPVLGGVAGLLWRRTAPGRALAAVSVSAMAYLATTIAAPVRVIDARKAPKELAAAAGLDRPAEEIRIASLDYQQPSLVFYARREVKVLRSPAEAIDFLQTPLPCFLVLPARLWSQIAPQAATSCRTVAKRHDLYHNLDVVVVTNR